MAKTFKSPLSFAYHVGHDLLVDGTDIYHEISASIDAYGTGDYHTFGYDVGKALSLVLIGKEDQDELEQMVAMSSGEIEQVLIGIVKGAINEKLPSVDTCITDIAATAADVEDAVADFKKKTLSDVEAGIRKLGDAVSSIATDLDACKVAIDHVEDLEKMAKTFKNPMSFAYHVGKDLLVDGKDIYAEITAGVAAYDQQQYETFGEDMGRALALVLVGDGGEDMFLQ